MRTGPARAASPPAPRPDVGGGPKGALGGRARSVLIVGGGASGVLLAAQLLRRGPDVHVFLVERREELGCGVAYSTSNASHLLNTRVSSMSAFPDEPDHFFDWLLRNHDREVERTGFVNRGVYGAYMAGLLAPWRGGPRLTCVKQDCLRLEEPEAGGVVAHLANGDRIRADVAVLATGHTLPDEGTDDLLEQPWSGVHDDAREGRVLIVGSGLTMVDQVMSLLDADHRGEIVVISRRGLLPQAHATSVPVTIRADELPLGLGATGTMRWLRARTEDHVARGGDWRDVVDGIRPHMQTLWRAFPEDGRRAFLRHACIWWEVHRHRMPPVSHARLEAARRGGQLTLMRGAFLGAWRDAEGGLRADLRPAGSAGTLDLAVARIIDCRGIRRDPEAHAGPLVADLLARGRARIDPMRIGLDVGPDCAVLSADGSRSDRIYAVGPASRAAFWEITAIPDIREQVADLAGRL